jgi:serine/threonine protein phosphatase PrpC
MRRNSSEFNTGFISEAGTFRTNKDYFAFMELDDMACWIAADGIDSDEDIESAEIAVKSIFADFSEKPVMSRRRIKKYLKNAHKTLKSESRSVRLKASIMVIITDYSKMVWATAGNVRMYHFRKGKFNFRSKDQSIAQMMADAGKINEYEINEHEERNNLTNYLGKAEGFKPYISKKYRLNEGDVMILCTPGFWENIDSVEMGDALSEAQNPEELVDNLEELLLGKQNRVLNNYTIAAVYANKVFKESPKNNMRWVKRVAAILIPILIACAGLFIYKKIDEAKTRDLLEESITSGDKLVGEKKYNEALKNYDTAIDCLKKLKEPETEEEVKSKQDITKLVTEGDSFFESKKYKDAREKYFEARSKAENENTFNKDDLEKKIKNTDKYIAMLELMNEGDEESRNKHFDKAKSKYEEALKIANGVYAHDLGQELNEKIQKVDNEKDKDKNNDPVPIIKQVQDFEKKGDEWKEDKEYKSAIEYYEKARNLCNKLLESNQDHEALKNFNAFEKFNALKEKILKCEKEMATATPLPAPAVIVTPTAVKG